MKIDRVHFYTRNAAKTRDWFTSKIGFKAIARRIDRHTHTKVVALNSACFVISSPLSNASPVANYLASHPSGAIDVAFRVDSIQAVIDRARALGREILQPIQAYNSDLSEFKTAQILGWNCLRHTLIEVVAGKSAYYLADVVADAKQESSYTSNITDIDHIVLNVATGKLESAVELYQALFGFEVQQSFNIQTEKSGLLSQALIDRHRQVQFNINEPTSNNSQI